MDTNVPTYADYTPYNKKIKELLQKGFYRLECFSTVSIDIKDYLVGVGNTGYNVDPDIEFCYLYTLFLNKEISEEELKTSLREVYCDYSNKIEKKAMGKYYTPIDVA